MEEMPHPEMIEGSEAAKRFDAPVRKVLSVLHEEIMRREAEYKRQSAIDPNRRGPKRKSKTSAQSQARPQGRQGGLT